MRGEMVPSVVLVAKAAAAAALLLLLSACDGEARGAEGEGRGGGASRIPVEVVDAERRSFEGSVEAQANVLPLRQEALVPRVPGRIEHIAVEEGDRVEEGQEVARLDQRDYRLALREADANLAAARANARLAAIGVESATTRQGRMKALADAGAIAATEMDKVVDGRRMGEAQSSAAEAQVQLAEVGLAAARTKIADTVLHAPFAGVVIKRLLDEGSFCGMSPETAAVMVVADLSVVKVQGSVGERELHLVRRDLPARVTVDARPGEVFEGVVEVVSPMVDPRSRTASVTVRVDNPEGRLQPGMAARLEVSLGAREAIALPHEALVRAGEGEAAEVFVVDREGRARRREVRVGARHGAHVEIVEGLEPGERVVRSNQALLTDGDLLAVEPRE